MTDNTKQKRSFIHDYCAPCIYMVTVVVEGRQPLLGRLAGDVDTAHIELTPLGKDVRHELYALCDHYPQLRLLQYQIMPDHVHVIIHVMERTEKPLGSLLSSWKIACGRAYARGTGANSSSQNKASSSPSKRSVIGASSGEPALAPQENPPYRRLFAEGYNDSILQGRGQLQHMIDYIHDNPRRLLLKRQQTSFFSIHRSLNIAGHTLDAIGNLDLLRQPLVAVHCRRHWSPEEQQAYATHCLSQARQGTVLIGAFISETEKAIATQARQFSLPLIHIMGNGFDDLYKPSGNAFYACAEGRLLQLAPWPYRASRQIVSREQCNAMNTLAESIAIQTQ